MRTIEEVIQEHASGKKEIYFPPGTPPHMRQPFINFYRACGFKEITVLDDSHLTEEEFFEREETGLLPGQEKDYERFVQVFNKRR